MNLTLEHIGLAARDTIALRDWYIRVLAAREIFKDRKSPPAFLIELPGGAWVEIYPAHTALPDTSDNRLAGWRHLALRVDSIDATRKDLAGRGVVFEEVIKSAGGGGRVLFFRDGEGNLIHLVERRAGVFVRNRDS
jgi:glyoxylase I family protein